MSESRWTRRSIRAGLGEESGISSFVICLVVTALLLCPWQHSRDHMANLWVVVEGCTTLVLKLNQGN